MNKTIAESEKHSFRQWGPVVAWRRFWFTPADPTTLGLMRILTGILVLYVHLVYTFDLQHFFGKDAFVSVQTANERRKGYSWYEQPLEWERKQPIKYLSTDETVQLQELEPIVPLLRKEIVDLLPPYTISPAILVVIEPRQVDLREKLSRLPPRAVADRNLAEKMLLDVLTKAEFENYGNRLLFVAGGDKRLTILQLNYKAFLNEWHIDPRTLIDPNTNKPLPEEERLRIMDYGKKFGADPRYLADKGLSVFSIWYHVTDPRWMLVAHSAVLICIVLFTLGFRTRITSVLVWLATVGYIHRAHTSLFGQDTMQNILLFYLMIGPSGAALSLDRLLEKWWANRQGLPFSETPAPSTLANVAYRLTQIHFCLIYFAAGTSKLQGGSWWGGVAVWMTMADPEFAPVNRQLYRDFLKFLADHRWLCEIVVGLGVIHTLFVELCFAFLVWLKRWKWFMLITAVLLHAGIALIMGLTIFQLYMILFLLPFFPSETVHRLLNTVYETVAMTNRSEKAMVAADQKKEVVVG